METVEQVNENFDMKKPKKKGLMIGLIVAALAIIVALVLVYFLVLNNPKFIFSKAIDKFLTVKSESYESVKMNTEIKASVDLEDASYQEELAEIEKFTLKAGTQMDVEKKQEIVDLGLEYDNKEVIDARVYYNDGDMYAYFDGIFDKYIQLGMDEETKTMLDEMLEMATSEENIKNTEKAIEIARDELKEQIKAEGDFENKKDTISVGNDEVKATKSTLTLTEKDLCNIISNMCSELSDNDDFIDCFEESPKDLLKEIENAMEDGTASKGNYIKIHLYTDGILNNKLVAATVEIYSEDEASTMIASAVKEDKDVYSYKASVKSSGQKMDLVKGKVELQKDKESKKEQSGKVIITAEIIELGSARLEIGYLGEYNQGIDKIDTSNSVNMNNLTEADFEAIMTKLMERPLIKELLENQMSGLGQENVIVETPTIETPTTQTETTTTQNEVKDYGYSVTYSVPTGFIYSQYSYDDMKFYNFEDVDYSYIDATVSLDWYTETEYMEDEINWDYKYYTEETDYTNVNLSEVKTIAVGDKTFKYVVISYDTDYGTKCQDVYVWYALDSEYMFTVKLEGTDKEVTEDIIKGFLNINVKK